MRTVVVVSLLTMMLFERPVGKNGVLIFYRDSVIHADIDVRFLLDAARCRMGLNANTMSIN